MSNYLCIFTYELWIFWKVSSILLAMITIKSMHCVSDLFVLNFLRLDFFNAVVFCFALCFELLKLLLCLICMSLLVTSSIEIITIVWSKVSFSVHFSIHWKRNHIPYKKAFGWEKGRPSLMCFKSNKIRKKHRPSNPLCASKVTKSGKNIAPQIPFPLDAKEGRVGHVESVITSDGRRFKKWIIYSMFTWIIPCLH